MDQNVENKYSGKRVLIIMPEFYSYQAEIKKLLDGWGAVSFIYSEQPAEFEYLIRKNIKAVLNKAHLDSAIDMFAGFNKKLLEKIRAEVKTCDYLLVIRGNILSEETVETIKREILAPDGHSTYYTWDYLDTLYHKGNLGRLFDERYSFDSVDVKKRDDYKLLPLFYVDAYDVSRSNEAGAAGEADEKKYDFCYIASFTPFRHDCMKQILEKNPDARIYAKLYWRENVYNAKKIKDPKMVKNLNMDLITFTPFTNEQIRDIAMASRCIIDITHEKQNGLTMRTIETIGMGQKLVTNNEHIAEYDFYRPGNISVLTGCHGDSAAHPGQDAFLLPGNEWLDIPYELDEDIRSKYSVKSWLETLLG